MKRLKRKSLSALSLILGVSLVLFGGVGCLPEPDIPEIESATAEPVDFGEVDPDAPTPEEIAEIQALMDEGKGQEAIEMAIEVYGLDVSDAPSVTYDETLPLGAYAETDPATGAIVVGPMATFSSPGELASCIGHEAVHSTQIVNGRSYVGIDENGDPYAIDEQGVYLQEYEAWQWELDHAADNNLSEEERQEVEDTLGYYYDALTPENQALADAGTYVLPGVDPYDPSPEGD